MKPEKDEYYWIQLSGTDHITIGKWHGAGFWVAGNDLSCFGDNQGIDILKQIRILDHIKKPVLIDPEVTRIIFTPNKAPKTITDD